MAHPGGRNRADLREKKTQIHPEDLMNADMLNEMLLVCGSVIFVALLLILLAALT